MSTELPRLYIGASPACTPSPHDQPPNAIAHAQQPELAEQLAKAATLSYKMPDAQSEIRRLDEMQRGLERELTKFRREPRPEHATLSDWLERNEDLSLADVNLGDSEVTIQAIARQDVTGLGRYAMRGDLRAWMDRVAQLHSSSATIAGEWSAEDARFIDQEVHNQVKKSVTKDLAKRKRAQVQLVQQICRHLHYISDGRDFSIDSQFVPDDLDQLRRLSEYVDDWHAFIERNGHPHKQAEAVVARRLAEEEAKRRQQQQGVMAAAQAAGVLLSDAQLDQVLVAFYEQKQPSTMLSKKEKARIERNMVTTLKREEHLVGAYESRSDRLQERVHELTAEVERLNGVVRDYEENPRGRQDFVEGLEQANALTQTAAEALARRRIRECEALVANITAEFDALQQRYVAATERVVEMQRENTRMRASVDDLAKKWQNFQVLKRQQEEEMARIHGGRVSDLQRVMSTLSDVVGHTTVALATVLGASRERVCGGAALADAIQMISVHRGATTDAGDASSGVGVDGGAIAAEMVRTHLAKAAGGFVGLHGVDQRVFDALRGWAEAVGGLPGISEGTRVAAEELRGGVLQAIDEAVGVRNTCVSKLGLDAENVLPATLPGPATANCSAGTSAAGTVGRTTKTVDDVPGAAKGLTSPFERAYVDAIVRRLDAASSELQCKFREARYMRSVIQYVSKAVTAMTDGRYDDFALEYLDNHDAVSPTRSAATALAAQPFPPVKAVGNDEPYGLVWSEELKTLDRMLTLLRGQLSDATDREGAGNALLQAVEVVADLAGPSKSQDGINTQSPTHGGPATDLLPAIEQRTRSEQVRRDARLLLHDHLAANRTHTGADRLKAVSAGPVVKGDSASPSRRASCAPSDSSAGVVPFGRRVADFRARALAPTPQPAPQSTTPPTAATPEPAATKAVRRSRRQNTL